LHRRLDRNIGFPERRRVDDTEKRASVLDKRDRNGPAERPDIKPRVPSIGSTTKTRFFESRASESSFLGKPASFRQQGFETLL